MRPVSATELERARSAFNDTLPEAPRHLIYDRARTAGATSRESWTPAPAASATVAASRSDPSRSEAQELLERYGQHARHVVTLEQGGPVKLRDRLDFGDQVLEVVGQLTGRGPWAIGARWAAVEVGERG